MGINQKYYVGGFRYGRYHGKGYFENLEEVRRDV